MSRIPFSPRSMVKIAMLLFLLALAATALLYRTPGHPRAQALRSSLPVKLPKVSSPPVGRSWLQLRQSNVWFVREGGADLLVLLLTSDDLSKHVPSEVSAPREIPRKAASRLLSQLGATEEEVDFLSLVVHGRFQTSRGTIFADLSTYVAMLHPHHAKNGEEFARTYRGGGRKIDWIPISRLASQLQLFVARGGADMEFAEDLVADFPGIRSYLEPIIRTAGKDPSKCLGPPPGWSHDASKSTETVWPVERPEHLQLFNYTVLR